MGSQNQVFRQIGCYLAELFRQIVCYLAQLFCQIAFPFKMSGSDKNDMIGLTMAEADEFLETNVFFTVLGKEGYF